MSPLGWLIILGVAVALGLLGLGLCRAADAIGAQCPPAPPTPRRSLEETKALHPAQRHLRSVR